MLQSILNTALTGVRIFHRIYCKHLRELGEINFPSANYEERKIMDIFLDLFPKF